MKRVLYIFGGLVAIVAIALSVVPYLIPSSVYRSQIEKQAETALGRDVDLQGDARLSIIPSISARVGGVTVANPEGFSTVNMIEAGELRARVKFLPLLTGRVEIAEISLVDANVSFERLPDGRANWVFSDDPSDAGDTGSSSGSVDAGIDRARLVNSSLSFIDAMTGSDYRFTDLNARASMQALDKSLSFVGDGVLNGETFELDIDLNSISAITTGQSASADLTLKTSLGQIAYDGSFLLAGTPRLDGSFDVTSERVTDILELAGLDVGVNLSPLGDLSAKGRVSGTFDALKLQLESARQSSDLMEATYSGSLDLSSTAPLDGKFTLETNNFAAAMSAFEVDMPIALAPIGSLNVAGSIKGSFTAPNIVFERFNQSSDLMDTDYTGAILIGSDFSLDGKLNTKISDAGRLLTQMGIDGGPVSALEKLEFSGGLSGPISALSVTNADLTHNGALLQLDYNGDLSLGERGRIGGSLSASSENLRGLLEAADVDLAPGETLKSFSVKGALSGQPANFSLNDLTLELDDVSGTGQAGLNISGAVPRFTADLNMPALDLTPFLGEPRAQTTTSAQTNGWSKTPLALESLRAVNADIKLKTPDLQIGKTSLKDADVTATLSGGDLDADIVSVNAFGGQWNGKLGLDASQPKSVLSIDMRGKNVAMQSVMSTFANLSSVSGTGNMNFSATSTGDSLDALVRGLNGKLTTGLSDGAVKGFNLAQIVRSLDSIQSALASGSLGFALSPEAQTDFTQFDSAFTITNGVANIDLMKAINPAVLLDGKGQINLANQSIDISITPSVDTRGAGELDMLKLNGEPFALPFRISGNWLSPSVSIDNAAIAQQLRQRAVGEIGGRISDELGGDLGGIVEGVWGGTKPRTPADDEAPSDTEEEENKGESDPEPNPDPEPEPETVEDALENLAEDALKDLFKRED